MQAPGPRERQTEQLETLTLPLWASLGGCFCGRVARWASHCNVRRSSARRGAPSSTERNYLSSAGRVQGMDMSRAHESSFLRGYYSRRERWGHWLGGPPTANHVQWAKQLADGLHKLPKGGLDASRDCTLGSPFARWYHSNRGRIMERLRLLVTSPAAGTEALATNAVELD